MPKPQIKSKKQLYRLWFEFLKMAHREPDLEDNLRQSAGFYAAWGDVKGQLFDPWWKVHKRLFGQTRVSEVERVTPADNALYIAIPLNQPASRSIADVRLLIEKKQKERLIEQGIDPETVKSLSTAFGRYNFTQGAEIRGKVLHETQVLYGIYQDLGKPAVNTSFVTEMIRRLKSRPRAKWIPHFLQTDPQTDKNGNLRFAEDQIRQVRRYIDNGSKVCCSVSLGNFPGKFKM
jgi:hypothetical protein